MSPLRLRATLASHAATDSRYLGLGVLRAPVAVPPPATSDPVLPFPPASPVWSGPFPGFSEGPLPTDEEVFPDFPVSAAF